MRIALISFIFVLSISFLGISSSAWACPDGFTPVVSECVSPGGPNPKDGILTIPEFQMDCMDVTKFAGHAQPVPGDKGKCGKGAERIWECCQKNLQ